MKWYEIIII